MLKDCPHKKYPRGIHHIGEDERVEYMARSIPKINATLDDHQADHQYEIVEVVGVINWILVGVVETMTQGNLKTNL